MPKKIPMRTCIGCGTSKPKKELIRIVRQQVPAEAVQQLEAQMGGADAG